MDKLKEECGVFGIYNNDSSTNTSEVIYIGLSMLQHRGQESTGIAVSSENGKIVCHKDIGLVSRVFDKFVLNNLKGNIGIGHVKYGSAKESNLKNVQPIVLKYTKDSMALSHNGCLLNLEEIRNSLQTMGFSFQSTSNTEVLGALLSKELINNNSIEQSIINVINIIKGAYSFVLTTSNKLIAVRDPLGMKPLCIGKLKDSFVISSESVAFNAIGAKFVRDVEPGEIVIIDNKGLNSINIKKDVKTALCIFEYVYFARPDSIVDGMSVYTSRIEAGKILAKENKIDADMVIGVPDSGIPAALGYSKESGIPYGEGFIKNRYIGRTFIQPSQLMREQSVHLKLSALKDQVDGKKIIMIDDSIVRGTTSRKIISLLKKAGAKEVHVLLASPPVKHCCYFGVDIPEKKDLIAHAHSIKETAEVIGADSLNYISLEGMKKAPILSKCGFCTGCFDGNYPIQIEQSKKEG